MEWFGAAVCGIRGVVSGRGQFGLRPHCSNSMGAGVEVKRICSISWVCSRELRDLRRQIQGACSNTRGLLNDLKHVRTPSQSIILTASLVMTVRFHTV